MASVFGMLGFAIGLMQLFAFAAAFGFHGIETRLFGTHAKVVNAFALFFVLGGVFGFQPTAGASEACPFAVCTCASWIQYSEMRGSN